MVSLVGVFVVTLIVVAVLAPLPRPEPLVTLPGANSFAKSPDSECQPVVSIQANGTLYLFEHVITPAELEAALLLRASRRRCTSEPLRLRADTGAPFSAIRLVTRAAREAHCKTITVLVEPGRGPENAALSLDFGWNRRDRLEDILLFTFGAAAIVAVLAAIFRQMRPA